MDNNFDNDCSTYLPMSTFELDEFDFPGLSSQETPIIHQPEPTPIQLKLVSNFPGIEPKNPIDVENNNNDTPSTFLDPQLLMLDANGPFELARTPFPAPAQVEGLLPACYHQMRANYHADAERWHRHEAEELTKFSQLYSDQCSPSEQPENTSSQEEHERVNKRSKMTRQHPNGRVSASGAVQKSEKPSSKALPAHISSALMTGPGLQQHARIADATELHPRVRRRLDYCPDSVYEHLAVRPSPWGEYQYDGQTLVGRFKYNEFGELTPGDVFTVEELQTYLFTHPLHTKDGIYQPKNGGLTIWIQRNPSDSKNRYGDVSSARCRFKDCIAQHRLIGQGQNRVCFDENSQKGGNLDPMHNAGYVHLYCLERYLSFPHICSTLQVKVEDRHLPNEIKAQNRMKLSFVQESQEAKRFIRNCERGRLSSSYPRCELPNKPYDHKGSLNHKLCVKKVSQEPLRIKRARVLRGDRPSTLSHHLGDLAMETEHRAQSRLAVNQVKRKAPGFVHEFSSDSISDDRSVIEAGPLEEDVGRQPATVAPSPKGLEQPLRALKWEFPVQSVPPGANFTPHMQAIPGPQRQHGFHDTRSAPFLHQISMEHQLPDVPREWAEPSPSPSPKPANENDDIANLFEDPNEE